MEKKKHYLTRAKYHAYIEEIAYMEGEGGQLMAKLLSSSPGSGMGRPNDLPVHQLAAEFMGYLQDAKAIVNSAVIIDDLRDESLDLQKVVLGCSVEVKYEDDGMIEEYTILGRHEVDVLKGRISCWSPLGSALLGRHTGDKVTVKQPAPSREISVGIGAVRRPTLDFDYSSSNWKQRLEQFLSL